MARYEDHSQTPLDSSSFRKEIRREVGRQSEARKWRGCGSCIVFFLILGVIPGTISLTYAASSGLLSVPMLTERFYRPVEPIRIVEVHTDEPEHIVANAMAQAESAPISGTLTVSFTEEQLTAVMAHAIETANGKYHTIHKPQIVITESGIEWFTHIHGGRGEQSTMTLTLVPSVEDGTVLLTPTSLRIGAMNVPSFVMRAIAQNVGHIAGQGIVDELSTLGTVTHIEPKHGTLSIRINPIR